MSWQLTSAVFHCADPDGEIVIAMEAFGFDDDAAELRFDFPEQGISIVRINSELRVAIHTWPEHALVTVDAYAPRKLELEVILSSLGWRAVRSNLQMYRRSNGTRDWLDAEQVLYSCRTTQHILVADTPDLGRVLLLNHRLSLAEADQRGFFSALASLVWEGAQSVVLNSACLLPLVPHLVARGVADVIVIEPDLELRYVLLTWFEEWLDGCQWQTALAFASQYAAETDVLIAVDPCWQQCQVLPAGVVYRHQLLISDGVSPTDQLSTAQGQSSPQQRASIAFQSLPGWAHFHSSKPF